MKYSAITLVSIVGLLAYNEILALKKEIKGQEKRLNQLAKLTDHEALSFQWISDELKERIIQPKRDGKEVETIKKVREQTKVDLVEVKQHIDDP